MSLIFIDKCKLKCSLYCYLIGEEKEDTIIHNTVASMTLPATSAPAASINTAVADEGGEISENKLGPDLDNNTESDDDTPSDSSTIFSENSSEPKAATKRKVEDYISSSSASLNLHSNEYTGGETNSNKRLHITAVQSTPHKFGKRLTREDYHEDDLKMGQKLNVILSRAIDQYCRKADSKERCSSKGHRENSYETLRLSCEQKVTEELNFPEYKKSYLSLLDLYDIELNGYDSKGDGTIFANSKSRVEFLVLFMEALCKKLSHSPSNPNMPTISYFIDSVRNL